MTENMDIGIYTWFGFKYPFDEIIALENLRKPEYLDFLFDNIKSDKLKFCYDSGHNNCFTPEIDCLGKYGDKLIALHLHDNDGTCDQHLLPFNGTMEI
jgi:sugar phosphate isomerase/epimerase